MQVCQPNYLTKMPHKSLANDLFVSMPRFICHSFNQFVEQEKQNTNNNHKEPTNVWKEYTMFPKLYF